MSKSRVPYWKLCHTLESCQMIRQQQVNCHQGSMPAQSQHSHSMTRWRSSQVSIHRSCRRIPCYPAKREKILARCSNIDKARHTSEPTATSPDVGDTARAEGAKLTGRPNTFLFALMICKSDCVATKALPLWSTASALGNVLVDAKAVLHTKS